MLFCDWHVDWKLAQALRRAGRADNISLRMRKMKLISLAVETREELKNGRLS